MNRLLVLLCILLFIMELHSIDVKCNIADGHAEVYMFIPHSQFLTNASNGKAQYQLNLNVLNQNKKNIFQNIYNIDLDKQDIMNGAAHVVSFNIPSIYGKYILVTQLKNQDLGDKKEQKTSILIGEETTKSLSLIIADNGRYKFCPSEYNQLNKGLKNCFMYHTETSVYDSVLIRYEINGVERRSRIYPTGNNKIDLLPYLQDGTISNPEIRYFSGNIVEKVKWPLYHANNQYTEAYSLREQMQQIKYIASQNEWKVLKKVTDRDLQNYIDKFWDMHNNHPGSTENETQDIFYERVLKADELFTIHKKLRGWKSDRGRIYIKFGIPDDMVEGNVTISNNIGDRTYPYIRWKYYKADKEFYFLDKSGYGNYKIVDEYYEN